VVSLNDWENISIIGYGNPTVSCDNIGLQFSSCHNCTIEGITWNGCSVQNVDKHTKPAILFHNSSSITIQNYSFQNSAGQIIVLSEASGDVNINSCKFENNSNYADGAAIHYLSNSITQFQLVFKVSNCNFTRNAGFKSVIYTEQPENLLYNIFLLMNSSFIGNQVTPICDSNHNICVSGKMYSVITQQ